MKSLFEAVSLCAAIAVAALVSSAQPHPDLLWERTYGGPNDDVAYTVRQTPDGGYVIAGITNPVENQTANMYLVRTDAQGDTVWTRHYGQDQYNDIARSLESTSDGGFVLAGSTNAPSGAWTDMCLIRTDSEGNTLWTRTYGGLSNDEAWAVKQTTDGGYVLVGWTGSYGPEHRNVYIVKTDPAGDTLWTRVYGTDGVEEAWSVQQTADGGYAIAGYADGQGEDTDIYVLRTDSQGDTLWTRKYGGQANEEAHAILQTSDGGLAIAAETWSFGMPAMYLVRTDEAGNVLWSRWYGPGFDFGSDEVRDLQPTADAGFVLAGNSLYWENEVLRFDAKLVRTDRNGDTLWTAVYGDSGSQTFNSVRITDDGGYILAGSTDHGPGGQDVWLVKTGPDPVSTDDHVVLQPSSYSLSTSPNPFNLTTTIEYDLPIASHISLRVFDLLGREVAVLKDGFIEAGSYRATFDGRNLASGIYFARLEAGKFSQTKKLMLLK